MRQARQIKAGLEQTTQQIKEEEQKYQEDNYGGTTPEETYQMFLTALKQQNTELASKYFILEKQNEYRQLLENIKQNGQWEAMLNDLLRPLSQKGTFLNEDWYQIEVVNEKNEVVSIITLTKVKNRTFEPLNSLWKISRF